MAVNYYLALLYIVICILLTIVITGVVKLSNEMNLEKSMIQGLKVALFFFDFSFLIRAILQLTIYPNYSQFLDSNRTVWYVAYDIPLILIEILPFMVILFIHHNNFSEDKPLHEHQSYIDKPNHLASDTSIQYSGALEVDDEEINESKHFDEQMQMRPKLRSESDLETQMRLINE